MAFPVDLHTHTRFGSACSYMEPADLAQRARQAGLAAVCITEHNCAWEEGQLRELSAESGLPLLAGIELSTDLGDVLVYGADGLAGRAWRASDLWEEARRQGGYLVAAHPFRRFSWLGVRLDVEEALANPLFSFVDAVEVFNGLASPREVELATTALQRLDLPGVAGSDSHAPHTVGRCYTEFERPVRSSAELVRELKAGRFRAVHALMGLTY